ncbi:S-adenosyl-L-methionine-dependent methyltransferase [Paraphysoderma sedebokerense]|nr:S-adenosyl-L-methionine-dependent methyltransferase [Paraphysoderma sedebokerense]
MKFRFYYIGIRYHHYRGVFIPRNFRTASTLSSTVSSLASSAKHAHTSSKPSESSEKLSSPTKNEKKKKPRLTSFDKPPNAPGLPRSAYTRYTYAETAKLASPPTCSVMLSRDFIDDSLYNPNYGYFSQNATIFEVPEQINFRELKSNLSFMDLIASWYEKIEKEGGVNSDGVARQIWHTPTELFKPWYGYAMAKYIITKHKRDYSPTQDLVIYEIGAGNGTLMTNILDYIREKEPEIYRKTRYNIVEISPKLFDLQKKNAVSRRHKNIEIINKSIFDWDSRVEEHCFFLAMEVVDNFSHDVIRYDYTSNQPYQGVVFTDEYNDYSEEYEPVSDPLIQRYLHTRSLTSYRNPLTANLTLRRLRSSLVPFTPNLTQREFIPTRLLQFLEVLKYYFPNHRLILSDFNKLPDAVPGVNAPVVQTRYQSTMIPVSTYLVQPGFFDIFFPTNFELLQEIYKIVMSESYCTNTIDFFTSYSYPTSSSSKGDVSGASSPSTVSSKDKVFDDLIRQEVDVVSRISRRRNQPSRTTKVRTHQQFLERYANLEATKTISGENPMLLYYENAKFLLT